VQVNYDRSGEVLKRSTLFVSKQQSKRSSLCSSGVGLSARISVQAHSVLRRKTKRNVATRGHLHLLQIGEVRCTRNVRFVPSQSIGTVRRCPLYQTSPFLINSLPFPVITSTMRAHPLFSKTISPSTFRTYPTWTLVKMNCRAVSLKPSIKRIIILRRHLSKRF